MCTCNLKDIGARPYITFYEIKEVSADGTGVFADSTLVSQTASNANALEMAKFLSELYRSEDRADLIRRDLEQRLNTNAARHRFRRLNRVTQFLDWETRSSCSS